MSDDKYHQAARDGYLDLLRDISKKEANTPDEDGMTPTLWAAYYGNLDALRLIAGRGGDPDRCSYIGNTALHCAALQGHLNCVSFLVNFGANLWALDNDLSTALDLAAINDRHDHVNFLDQKMAEQSALNQKTVKKLKEKAALEAQKRVKKYGKLQDRARKAAEKVSAKEDREILKQLQHQPVDSRISTSNNVGHNTVTSRISSMSISSQSHGNGGSIKPKVYSELVNNTHKSGKRTLGAHRKIQMKRSGEGGDFKVSEGQNADGQRTVRSLNGLRRGSEVLYVPSTGYTNGGTLTGTDSSRSTNSNNPSKQYMNHLNELFHNKLTGKSSVKGPLSGKESLSHAISEPDIYIHTDSGYGDDTPIGEPSSMFERPGFGMVAFRTADSLGALLSLPQEDEIEEDGEIDDEDDNLDDFDQAQITSVDGVRQRHSQQKHLHQQHDKLSRKTSESISDSIGSIGSLAQRNKEILPWDEDDLNLDDEDQQEASALEAFLASYQLREYWPVFHREQLDLTALMLCSDADLKEIGLPLGPRKKILDAIEKRKQVQRHPGILQDSSL